MRVILTIFCVLALLFVGYCGPVLGSNTPVLGLGFLAIGVLNVATLIGVWGKRSSVLKVSMIALALIDLGLAIFLLAFSGDRSLGGIAVFLGVLVVFKGCLTLSFAIPRTGGDTGN